MGSSLENLVKSIGKPMHYHESDVREGLIGVLATERLATRVNGVENEGPIYDVPVTFPEVMGDPIMKRSLLRAAILGIVSRDFNGAYHLIARFPQADYKTVVEVFGNVAVAVAVKTDHPVNKSLSRIIKRTARREGLRRLESSPVAPAANDTHISTPTEVG
jgi:hypothetical protein